MFCKKWGALCLMCFLGLLGMASMCANAALVVTGTRIVFDQKTAQAVVPLNNQGSSPMLVQMWLDTGQDRGPLEEVSVPFTIVPAVARIDPGQQFAVRILQTDQGLAQDRETLFWFNALQVPPTAKDSDRLMQFAFRTRMKFFYRPNALPMTPEEAHQRLRFRIDSAAPTAVDGALSVRVHNPSPYFLTFRSLDVRASAQAPAFASLRKAQERMVAPWSDAVLQLDLPTQAADWPRRAMPEHAHIFFSVVNDHGGESSGERNDVQGGGGQ